MSPLEYRLASTLLRLLGVLFDRLPFHADRVVLATARVPVLEGNLRFIHDAITRMRPERQVILLLEPYGFGLRSKLRYLARVIRGHVSRADGGPGGRRQRLPAGPCRPHRRETTVVQVWHAAGALKRFGMDARRRPAEPELTFLHRYYDFVVTSGEAAREPWAAALRTPVDRVLPLGTPRTDLFFDADGLAAARSRALAAHPELVGRRVILYAPTFRGRGAAKRGDDRLDAERLRASLPATDALVLKTHPNLDPRGFPVAGYDVVASPTEDMNDLLALADVLLTDYSSSIFEFALLRRPIVILAGDLEAYERDPGLYLDLRHDMVGTVVTDTDGAAAAIVDARVDPERMGRLHRAPSRRLRRARERAFRGALPVLTGAASPDPTDDQSRPSAGSTAGGVGRRPVIRAVEVITRARSRRTGSARTAWRAR